ncbi:MAG: PQQ-binding-like beta-propeller repeat protein [Treponema sp.]|nr:PQQ-binding-like beta-propeller repeat protein [Treponema sp.]
MADLKKTYAALLLGFLAALLPAAEAETAGYSGGRENAAVPVWRQALAGEIIGVPAIQAGMVTAVLDGGNIRAYTLEGRPLWDYYAGGKLTPFVTRAREGTSYVCRLDGELIAVNRAGRELWRIAGSLVTAPVVVGWDGRLFAAAGQTVSCYTASGYTLWRRSLEAPLVLGPFLNRNGGITAALENGQLLDISSQGKVETRALGEAPAALIPVSGGIAVISGNGRVRLFRDGSARGRDAANLRETAVAGVSLENRAAALLASGSVAVFSVPDGRVLWTEPTHIHSGEVQGPPDAQLIWDERGIYVLSAKGVTCLNERGRKLWSLTITGGAALPALSGDGRVFSGGRDWILYAYQAEDRALAVKQSLYGPAPEGDYGLGKPPPSPWAGYYYQFDEIQMNAELAKVTELIKNGIGEHETDYTAYLMEIGGSATGPQTSPTHPPVHVRQRGEAIALLGLIGSRETIPFLAGVYIRDRDPTVRSAAAEAIGRIGVDPEGIALRAFSRALTTNYRDEQVLVSTAIAIGSLCRFSGPPLSEAGLKLLGLLERDFMPSRARAQARRETESLRRME